MIGIFRLIIILLVLLAFIYYVMDILQCFGVISFTNRKLTAGRVITPFYYWIASQNEKPKPVKEVPEDIKRLREKVQKESMPIEPAETETSKAEE